MALSLIGALAIGGCGGAGAKEAGRTSAAPATAPSAASARADSTATSAAPPPTLASSPANTQPAPGSASSAPGAQAGPDLIAVTQSLLRAADFPTGWSGAPYETSVDLAAINARVASCAGYDDSFPKRRLDAHGDTVSQGQNSVDSEVFTMPSAAQVHADAAVFALPKYATCTRQSLMEEVSKVLTPGQKLLPSTMVTFEPRQSADPSAVVGYLHSRIDLAASGVQHSILQEGVLLAQGTVEAELDFTGVDTPFPDELRRTLTSTFVRRVAALG